jgi:hypothetical protein
MLISFSEFNSLKEFELKKLEEKLIVYGNDAKYGQIVFLAGGAGSGKGFAIKNFMHGELFKIRDVDELKTAFMALDDMKKFTLDDLLTKYGDKISEKDKEAIQRDVIDKGYTLKDLNLKEKTHVYALHVLVAATGIKNKTLDLILSNAKESKLPNIMFDMTFKDVADLNETVPKLISAGYAPKNIHVTWILTQYEVAIKNNAGRARVVPDNIMLATHSGAAITMSYLIKNGLPREVDGGMYVVLNNRKNTVFFTDPKTGTEAELTNKKSRKEYLKNLPKQGDIYRGARGNEIDTKTGEKKNHFVIKDFEYITLKKPGKPMTTDTDVKKQLYTWITDNVPKSAIDKVAMDEL